ncbi:ABC transporter ATP-binding protein [Nocardioides carbamazepini]|uniref:dipeptide ABC transporter ATP-binding protein n=1 Tax=Nocardioides carbamazepini TaxID=2854259 RepID=UPI00214A8405|nr:ABC transporter ATP-binding protein [Nocardioides carbamazepini]MCR1783815.1 ABC transporter ATP-binding protein [Nocardioides carbamazepini]
MSAAADLGTVSATRVLDVRDLTVAIEAHGRRLQPVSGVSLHISAGETLGLVGESGSGKSMTGAAIMGMLPPGGTITGGSVTLGGRDLRSLSETDYRQVRGNDIAMVFQDSLTSLNPTRTIGYQIAEPVRIHRGASRKEAWERAAEVLSLVGIPRPAERLGDYPHQLSGGMRQRVMIAMALACEPKVIIADEPTTALDVTMQAQVLTLLDGLKERLGMAMILITHDMGVIAGRADRVNVMYAGRIAEAADTEDLFAAMRHPYTHDLLASIPLLDQDRSARLYSISGLPPDLSERSAGCPYASRCRRVSDACTALAPELIEHMPGHAFACWHPMPPQSSPVLVARRQANDSRHEETVEDATPPRLAVSGLVKEYDVRRGWFGASARLSAVAGVSFEIAPGQTYGLVGESGCGKSTLGRTIIGLERPTAGEIRLDGLDLEPLKGGEGRRRRRPIQMMFQDPYASLDPRLRVAAIIREPLRLAGDADRSAQDARVRDLLDAVGLPTSVLERLPHELSGGQRQRVGLARALAVHPSVLVADEPVSALDVSVRSQVLNLMKDLQADLGLTSLVISHDLAVVKYLADRIGVMYLGKLVEEGAGEDIYQAAAHPYTAGLIAAIPEPVPDVERAKPAAAVTGELPSAIDPPSGCRFRTRCPLADDICAVREPELIDLGAGHKVACHFPLRVG